MAETIYAPGLRVMIRDEEWLVRKVDRASTGGQALSVVGLSELVKDKEAIYLDSLDAVEIVDPAETDLIADTSSYYRDSILYIESLLRQTPPTDDKLYIGYQGAMDIVPYQLDPAIQALKQPRQRILLADAVGLGKTIEAGILLSELIKRGKGKRILVLTVKSMLTQFQKELWSRFTIPLVRLDSIGIQRVRTRIPTNHNPFYYYDKAIISIDTLKQDIEYRTNLEKCYWDIIVIDEAHNVAERGSHSQRSKLAKLLSSRSDTLIMLSATPHDGRASSFASLMNMLNPTAIADPDNYGPEDIKGLYIRRFKKDIKEQVASSFKERKIAVARCSACPVEEEIFDAFTRLTFTKIDQKRTAGKLFKTTLEKSLFSSPVACLETANNRVSRLKRENPDGYKEDILKLEELSGLLQKISSKDFSKYQKLLSVIRDKQKGFGWDGKDTQDRLVIFTERIDTLDYLEGNLLDDLGLKADQIRKLHGGLSDVDQQQIVEDFGKEQSPVRLLLASDVASEGINLHFLCHKMIHFDIPWSLMVFQQRNGRIDRYGQESEPQIVYLMTDSANEKIRGDNRILELLIKKDDEAVKNIGDPQAFMGVYDVEQEEVFTATAIEEGDSEDDFEARLKKATKDPLALLMAAQEIPKGNEADSARRQMTSLFKDDFVFLQEAVNFIKRDQELHVAIDAQAQTVNIAIPQEMERRFKFLPPEIVPENGEFILSADRKTIISEIKKARKEENVWPRIHLLWEQHPVMQWMNDKLLAAFGRRQAPVITLPQVLAKDEVVFLMSGLIPNRKSHPLVQRWFGVRFVNKACDANVLDFPEILKRTSLGAKQYPNQSHAVDAAPIKKLLPKAIDKGNEWMKSCREEFNKAVAPKLMDQLRELDRLRKKQQDQLELRFANIGESFGSADKKGRERREIERIFNEYQKWIEETMSTEDKPYIRVVAVLKGSA